MVDGRKIRHLRELANLTTGEFAEIVASSQTHIVHVETGLKQPSVALLKRIADYFGLTVDDFIKEESA